MYIGTVDCYYKDGQRVQSPSIAVVGSQEMCEAFADYARSCGVETDSQVKPDEGTQKWAVTGWTTPNVLIDMYENSDPKLRLKRKWRKYRIIKDAFEKKEKRKALDPSEVEGLQTW